MRPAHLITVLDKEFTSTTEGHHTPVMLWGPPGVGKSQMVSEVAARHHVPLIDIRLSQMEPSDLRGIPIKRIAQVKTIGEGVAKSIKSQIGESIKGEDKELSEFIDEI